MKRLAWTVLRLKEKVVKSTRYQRKIKNQKFDEYVTSLHSKKRFELCF